MTYFLLVKKIIYSIDLYHLDFFAQKNVVFARVSAINDFFVVDYYVPLNFTKIDALPQNEGINSAR